MASYKQKTVRYYYNPKLKLRLLVEGDLVLRETEASYPTHTVKIMPNWEGPYKILKVIRSGTFKLNHMSRENFNNTSHTRPLNKYYPYSLVNFETCNLFEKAQWKIIPFEQLFTSKINGNKLIIVSPSSKSPSSHQTEVEYRYILKIKNKVSKTKFSSLPW